MRKKQHNGRQVDNRMCCKKGDIDCAGGHRGHNKQSQYT